MFQKRILTKDSSNVFESKGDAKQVNWILHWLSFCIPINDHVPLRWKLFQKPKILIQVCCGTLKSVAHIQYEASIFEDTNCLNNSSSFPP